MPPARPSLLLLVLLLAVPCAAPVDAGAPVPGSDEAAGAQRTVGQVLQALQDRGFPLVWSEALVPAGTPAPPPAGAAFPDDPEARARAVLEPHGLTLERAPSGAWYVVRAPAEPSVPDGPVPVVSPPRIEELVVLARRYRLVRDDRSATRLDRRALDAIPSLGRDVLRSLRQLPGQANSGLSARAFMRGGDADEVLYLFDGVRLFEPFHLSDFQSLFTALNPHVVGGIDVYNSGFPVRWGSRMAGVIELDVADAREPFEGVADVNLVTASALLRGAGATTDWLVSARRSTLDAVLDSAETDYGRPAFDDLLLRVARDGERVRLVAGYLRGNDELTLRDPDQGEQAEADYDNDTAWVRATLALSDTVDLSVLASHAIVDNERSGTLEAPADASGALTEARSFSVSTVRPELSWRFSEASRLEAGLEGQVQRGTFSASLASTYGPVGQALQGIDGFARDYRQVREGTLASAWLSLQHRLGSAWSLEWGLRFDAQDIDPVHDREFSPRLQIEWAPSEALAVFLNGGRYAQYQNVYELQLDDGLPELQAPQLADQISLGLDRHLGSRWELRVEGYLRDVDAPRTRFDNLYDPWVLLPELHGDRVALRPDRARSWGFEGTVRYGGPRLETYLAYALASTRERQGGVWRDRPWSQRHAFHGGLTWRTDRWSLSTRVTFRSGWPTTPRVSAPGELAEALYADRLPDFLSVDVHVARRFPLPRGELEVYLDLANATAHDNIGGYVYTRGPAGFEREAREPFHAVPALGVSYRW
jgi:hypothetical protein